MSYQKIMLPTVNKEIGHLEHKTPQNFNLVVRFNERVQKMENCWREKKKRGKSWIVQELTLSFEFSNKKRPLSLDLASTLD